MTHDKTDGGRHPVRFSQGQVIRVIVYVMLVVSAGVAVLLGDSLWNLWRGGHLPVWAPLLAPGAFTAFVAVYTIDRCLLVRRRRYPLGRALFQVAFALVFLTLLLPQQALELRQVKHQPNVGDKHAALLLLDHTDPEVRAATCALMIGPFATEVYERVGNIAHLDPAAKVRLSCAHALQRLHDAASDH